MKCSSVSFRSVLTLAGAAVLVLASSSGLRADVTSLDAVENTQVESAFTLNFGDLGIATSSKVITTRFQLDIDEDAGTAAFVSYEQQVEPLILPGPTGEGISTGELTIRIIPGSSSGTYNPATETFTTNEEYEISFSGDLSAFGLVSPVVLPSTTVGQLKGGSASATEIQMNWSGVGQLANPGDPTGPPLDFNYVCEVNTVINRPATDPAAFFVQTLSDLCGGGAASLMAFGFVGFGIVTATRRRR